MKEYNGDDASKAMQAVAHTTYIDLTEHIDRPIVTDENGWAEFQCKAGSVSVWVPEKQ